MLQVVDTLVDGLDRPHWVIPVEAALPSLPVHRDGHAVQLRACYRLAQDYLQAGDPTSALRIAGTFRYDTRDYKPHLELLRARAREAMGEPEAARRHYGNVIHWWEDRDPELQGVRESAREDLRRLAGEG